MAYTKNEIILEARQIKKFIETNKKIPMSCTMKNGDVISPYSVSLLIAKTILNKESSFVGVVKYNTNSYSDKVRNLKVKKNTYIDMLQRFANYCAKNRRVPSNIIIDGEYGACSFELFFYCMCKILIYYSENQALPNYCIFNAGDVQNTKNNSQNTKKSKTTPISSCKNPYVSSPHLTTTKAGLGQNYPWDCSCNAVQQSLYKLSGKIISEDTLVKVGGVTTAGCGHDGINTMIAWFNKKYGTNYSVSWKYFSDLGKTRDERFKELGKLLCKKDIAILCHIGYANAGNSKITSSSKVFGHYECLSQIDIKNKTVIALNSLGNKINKNAYAGHLQKRSFETQASFFAYTPAGQKALCIITK